MSDLTLEQLKAALHYDSETGTFTWINNRGCPGNIGAAAGRVEAQGYIRIKIGRRKFPAHRLAWLYSHGRWPNGLIDHIDGNRANNALSNLRVATHRENQQNKLVRRDSKSGLKGVYKSGDPRKWGARIRVDGRRVFLGKFDSPELAAAAYVAAELKYFGEFASSIMETKRPAPAGGAAAG